MRTEVLIVGAGPTGLTLANELRVAGVPTVLADALEGPSPLSKAGGVQSRTLAVLDQRGLLEPLLATGNHPVSAGHFAGIDLPPEPGRGHLPWRSIPQAVIEDSLLRHLAAHDIHVRRGHRLTGLTQHPGHVTAEFATGATIDARGADGTSAAVFPLGTDPHGRPLRRVALGRPGPPVPRDVPVTEQEIRDGLHAVFGDTVTLLELRYARRITNTARQVEHYRHGRVFLAGDAAHVHLPLGAQGMNTGIQDAVNLGWKLAADVHGWAPPHLLDTYHAERHPVGAAVLRTVQAQSLLMDWDGSGHPDLPATQALFAELAQLPDVRRHLTDRLSGMAIRYPTPHTGHPSIGLPVPDLDLGPVRVHELLRTGRGVLLDPHDTLGPVAARWAGRVDRSTGVTGEPALIRPDGYVAWAGDTAELEPALGHWFGAAR